MVCLYSNSPQGEGERRGKLEKLKDSLAMSDTPEDNDSEASAPNHGQRLEEVLRLLATGTIDSVCMKDATRLARTEDDLAGLEPYLRDNDIALVVGEADEPSADQHGRS